MSETPKPSVSYNDSLKMVHNPDGSVTRLTLFPITSASPNPDQYTTHTSPFLSKDITINTQKNIWVRVFLPRQALENNTTTSKLPLIVYFHGGGFITCSANTSVFHDLCSGMATDLSAVVVSLEYRLAPEYRLPAAYDDAEEALHWIKSTDEPWVTKALTVTMSIAIRWWRKGAEQCEKIGRLGWKVLVTGCDGDLLLDRQKEWVEMAKKKGVAVDSSLLREVFM
ncbi:putative carboxylesterase 120 [Vitis vinifera]|uniref:Putative carboxylesterase 120 n=1 Tax=Vitis vinifera TaxID=29760 RepID=A0A438JGZ1_VITVI|nr:putative carboxylesterase 120 [Vitis vinifera]